jgi:hypothetical protein
MRGLVPRIHVLLPFGWRKQDVDGREEPGHDGGVCESACAPTSSPTSWGCSADRRPG